MERRSRGKLIAIAGTVGALLGVYLLEKAQAKPVTPPTVITPPAPTPTVTPTPTPTTVAPAPAVIGKTPADIPSEVWDYLASQLDYEMKQLNTYYNQKYIQVNYTFSGDFYGHPANVEVSVSGYDDWIILGVSLPKWTYTWGYLIAMEYFYAPSWFNNQPPTLEYMKQRVVDMIIENLKQNIYTYFNGKVTVYNTKTFQVLTVSL